jgi:glycosyltransferase involved in cell wall biosynthesis
MSAGERALPGDAPSISVYMPVRNGEPYLDDCLASIVRQSDPRFELLVLDDGSNDGSRAILERWAGTDSRIRLIDAGRRLGLVGGLNRLVGEARAPLCARMDADDIAHSDRLRRQRDVLNGDPSVVLVGALAEDIDRQGRRLRPRDRWRLVRPGRVPPFAHPTVMFRRALFDEIGGYRESTWLWEDADLCYRMAARGRIMIVPDVLYFYRLHAGSTTLRNTDGRTTRAVSWMFAASRRSKPQARLAAEAGEAEDGGPRRDAAALYYVAASRLWAGMPPAFVGRLRDLPRRPLAAALKLLVVATWGRWSPSSLRGALRRCIILRDAVAGLVLEEGAPVEWRWR